MIEFNDFLRKAIELKASDIHITAGIPPTLRINGVLTPVSKILLSKTDTEKIVRNIMSDKEYEDFIQIGELDFSYNISKLARFRVNAFFQQGKHAMVMRVIPITPPNLDDLKLPYVLKKFTNLLSGLILVTGPAGSGKSTTLAAMINEINIRKRRHIITLEDPIEFVHENKMSILNQREIGNDTKSYTNGLRAALREDPDVIFIGEMRDLETISIAITAAETGHLVLSTVHTLGAAKTVDRIVDVFPPHQQNQIKLQLSNVIEGIVSQQLVQKNNGSGRVCAMEIMVATPAIRNLIREGKTHQIDSIIQTGRMSNMITMDSSLEELYKNGLISLEEAIKHATNKNIFENTL
jgi:twitching motility protein PilT